MNNLPPCARKTDPASSHIAAQYMNATGARETQTMQVAQLVNAYPGFTASELLAHTTFDRSQLARRLPDGRSKGWLKNGVDRKSRVTGHQEQTWYPV